jgi:hypothetical protein
VIGGILDPRSGGMGRIVDPRLTPVQDELGVRAQRIATEILVRARHLDPRDRNEIDLNLSQIEQILRQGGGRPYPHPGPVPYPGPRPVPGPNPYPQPYPGYPQVNCTNDQFETYRHAFERIKAFAYSASGLNYSSSGALEFAQRYTQEHSCASVDTYIDEIQRLIALAYDSRGLNLSTSGARNYALQKIDSICQLGFDYLSEARRYYDFAYSPQGLNLSSSGASQYARQQVEAQHLSCPGRIRI